MIPSSVGFIGAGRAAQALARHLHAHGIAVGAVYAPTTAHAERVAADVGAAVSGSAAAVVHECELTLVAVPDRAITAVAATVAASGVAARGRGLAHLSAVHGPSALAAARITGISVGAFHPLQTLAGPESSDLLIGSVAGVAGDPLLLPHLSELAAATGMVALEVPDSARRLYHLAAVLAGNVPLAILGWAADLAERAGLDRDIAADGLARLFEGAGRNAVRSGIEASLTGPVVRDDAVTVRKHLAVLTGIERERYLELARMTLELAGAETHPAVAALLAPERLRRTSAA